MSAPGPEPIHPAPPDVRLIPINQVVPSPTNPRKRVDEQGLADLAESIRRIGVLAPILVRPANSVSADSDGGRFLLVAGERRWRASQMAGLVAIPAIVRVMNNAQVLEAQIIENLQREDVHPLEEAAGYQRLMKEAKLDVARIAERVGRSVKYIYDRVKLLALAEPVKKIFLEDRISAGHAILLARLAPKYQKMALDPKDRGALWQPEDGDLFNPEEGYSVREKLRIEARKADPYNGLKARSVRELQAWIDQHVRFDPDAPDLPDLFPETAAVVSQAKEEREKVVLISHGHFVQPEARDQKERIYCASSWKRAEKPCDHMATGVVAAGYGRGEAFKVCIEKKKCKVHWADEQRDAARRRNAQAKGDTLTLKQMRDKQSRENERRDARRKDLERAEPAVLAALAEAIRKADATPAGPLAIRLLRGKPDPKGPIQPGKTAEDLVRYLVWDSLACDYNPDDWSFKRFQKEVKPLGLDAGKIVDRVTREAKVQTSAPEKAPAPAKKKAAKKAPRRKP